MIVEGSKLHKIQLMNKRILAYSISPIAEYNF
jgi:hypothetical protein